MPSLYCLRTGYRCIICIRIFELRVIAGLMAQLVEHPATIAGGLNPLSSNRILPSVTIFKRSQKFIEILDLPTYRPTLVFETKVSLYQKSQRSLGIAISSSGRPSEQKTNTFSYTFLILTARVSFALPASVQKRMPIYFKII